MRLEVVRIVADWLGGVTLDVNGARQGVNQMLGQNRLLRSEAFNNAAWVKNECTITADATASPIGTASAEKVTESATPAAVHTVSQSVTGAVAGETLAARIWFKAAERTECQFYLGDAAAGAQKAGINFSTAGTQAAFTNGAGVVIAQRAVSEPNGWWRLEIVVQLPGVTTVHTVVRMVSGGLGTYSGDGVSGFYIWGAQMERRGSEVGVTVPSPYRQTQGAAVGPLPVDAGDSPPAPIADWTDPNNAAITIAVYDETRHDWAANRLTDPPSTPALSVIVQDRIQVTGEATPDGQIRRTHAPVQIAIRYLTANVDIAEGVRDGDYIVRAVIRSLRELSRNQNAEARKRNGILLELFEDPMEIYPIVEGVGETYVAGAVVANAKVRDYNPAY